MITENIFNGRQLIGKLNVEDDGTFVSYEQTGTDITYNVHFVARHSVIDGSTYPIIKDSSSGEHIAFLHCGKWTLYPSARGRYRIETNMSGDIKIYRNGV